MIVTGKVKWAFINSLANTDSKKYKNCWKVDLYPDAEGTSMLESLGVEAKEDKDGGLFYRVKRNEEKNDGTVAEKPVCVDKKNAPFTSNVGNGSLCKVQFSPYPYDGDTLLYLKGVQVLDLVSYDAPDGAEFADETGESEFKNEEVSDEEKNPF